MSSIARILLRVFCRGREDFNARTQRLAQGNQRPFSLLSCFPGAQTALYACFGCRDSFARTRLSALLRLRLGRAASLSYTFRVQVFLNGQFVSEEEAKVS